MSLKDEALELGKNAKEASRGLARLSSTVKNRALVAMAEAIERQSEFLLKENKKDVEQATKARLSGALVDRITIAAQHREHAQNQIVFG